MDLTAYWGRVNPGEFLQTQQEGYDKPIRQLYRQLLGLLGVTRMLEVGCGPGVDYLGARNTVPGIDYTGVDITPQMIAHCTQLYPEGQFMLADIYQLPFADNSFPLVYCKDVLNHLEDWERGFSELHRVSSGYVLVNFFYGLGTTTFARREVHDGHINHYYDWNEVMAKLSGFKPLALIVYPRVCEFEETMVLFQKA